MALHLPSFPLHTSMTLRLISLSPSRLAPLPAPQFLKPRGLSAGHKYRSTWVMVSATDSDRPVGSGDTGSDAGAGDGNSPSSAQPLPLISEDDPSFWERVQAHQGAAARLPPVEEARTLLERCSRAVLSTSSQKYPGYPFGSAVAFASDRSGSPLLAVSSLSQHTADLLASPQCSLLISRDFAVPAEPLVTLLGVAEAVDGEEEAAEARASYLKRHPGAFWVDFGDFRFIRVRPSVVRMTSNIATFAVGASVSEFTGEKFCESAPDDIAAAEGPVAKHMNADHEDALIAIAQHSLAVEVPAAKMLTLDRLGFVLEIPFRAQTSRIRIAFPRAATSRKDVKDLLVEMTRAASSFSRGSARASA